MSAANRRRVDAVILNPYANAGNGASRWKALVATEYGQQTGLVGAALFDGSQGLDQLQRWVSDRIRAGARNFVAAGGDGTMNLALNALLNASERTALAPGELRLGAVGLGSSNDFQKPYFSEGRMQVAGSYCRLNFDLAFAQDVGCLQSEEACRFFVINGSVGVTAEANWNFNEAQGALGFLKRHWVDGAIIATALKTFKSYRNFKAKLSIDGDAPRELALTNLGVVKNVHFSGQMRYDVPRAPDDGFFGVHGCEGMSRLEMVSLLSALNSGKFSGRPKTWSEQARRVEISAAQAFAVETDGEVIRTTRAVFTILPREIYLCP